MAYNQQPVKAPGSLQKAPPGDHLHRVLLVRRQRRVHCSMGEIILLTFQDSGQPGQKGRLLRVSPAEGLDGAVGIRQRRIPVDPLGSALLPEQLPWLAVQKDRQPGGFSLVIHAVAVAQQNIHVGQ